MHSQEDDIKSLHTTSPSGVLFSISIIIFIHEPQNPLLPLTHW